jgi:glycerol uptake facilitator-like aquaporin
MDRALARSLVAELIGTFALVFAGAGAIMVGAKTQALGHVGVPVVRGEQNALIPSSEEA